MKNILTPLQHRGSMRKWKNNGLRTLYESAISEEVIKTLQDWKIAYPDDNSVLIGGLALMYYIKPRPTEDIDLIFLSEDDIPSNVDGFKRVRPHGYRHKGTHVEVEVLTHSVINQSKELFDEVFRTSNVVDGVRVASPLSIIALKLGRYKGYDAADIDHLIIHCKNDNVDLNDIKKYNLNKEELDNFWKAVEEQSINESNGYPDNFYMLECRYAIRGQRKVFEINNTSNKDFPYDIIIVDDGYEKRFNFGNDFMRERGITNGFFQFEISLENFDIDDLDIVGSSTDFKTFFGFEKEGEELKEWLVDNIDKLDVYK